MKDEVTLCCFQPVLPHSHYILTDSSLTCVVCLSVMVSSHPLFVGYGMTEAAPVITVTPDASCVSKPASVGTIIPNTELKVSQ